ncbi:MAG: endonuclease/exonuclease/phosphatase family protein [Isosphaeraceae bacterium]
MTSPTSRRGRVLLILSWVYAGLVLLLLLLVRWVGDAWWGVTPLLLSPRGVFLIPVAVLALVSGLRRCFTHWLIQGATALAVAGPFMGGNLPVWKLWERSPIGERVRVATFNLGMPPFPPLPVEDWLKQEKVDVVCFQEGSNAAPLYEALESLGWHLNRQKSIASKFRIVEELEPLQEEWAEGGRYSSRLHRARLETPGGRTIVVATVHLPTLRPGLQRLSQGDVDGLQLHVAWWGKEMSRVLSLLAKSSDAPTLIGGDFNMPSDDSTMAALRTYFNFAFEEAGWGFGYTRPAEVPWVRIDHLLASPEWGVTQCRVGPDLGSDHRPAVAEFVLPPARPGR